MMAAAMAATAGARAAVASPLGVFHVSSLTRVLVVGDGDFTFSRALVRASCAAEAAAAAAGAAACPAAPCDAAAGRWLCATSLDTAEELVARYPGVAEACVEELRCAGARVLHGVDGTRLRDSLAGVVDERSFHAIIFNFPHRAGKSRIHLSRALVAG